MNHLYMAETLMRFERERVERAASSYWYRKYRKRMSVTDEIPSAKVKDVEGLSWIRSPH